MSEHDSRAPQSTETATPARAVSPEHAVLRLAGTGRPLVQRRCACGGTPGPTGECAECRRKRERLQRSLAGPSAGRTGLHRGNVAAARRDDAGVHRSPQQTAPRATAPPVVHRALQSPGRPLDPDTRHFMESRLGHDLARVRVHTDGRAASSARAVSARAYAVGRDVVFAAGQYAPHTRAGLGLLAHELVHTVQQGGSGAGEASGALQRRLEIGAGDDPAERQAERIARRIASDGAPLPAASVPRQGSPPFDGEAIPTTAPDPAAAGGRAAGSPVGRHRALPIAREAGPALLRREPTTPQRRGGPERKATLEQPPRGDDQVRIHVLRYLCQCRGFDVTRTSLLTRTSPNPGATFRFCRGRTTVGITGDVIPSGFISGTVRAGVVFNVAPRRGGTGVRVQVEGEARNTGDEPEVGGRVRATVETPEGTPNVGVSGGIRQGTESGRVSAEGRVEVQIDPDVTIFGEVTNPQDERRSGSIGIQGRFGSAPVQRDVCRECRCPVVYDCFEDIPPRSFEEEVEFQVEDETSLRYYFSLNTNRDARDPGLRAESRRTLDRLEQLVAAGASVVSITGHASPEADQEELNQALSETRGQRLHELIAARLGPDVSLPEPTGGGELLGSRATILPGSGLDDAILEAGFDGPEEVSAFLIGEEIENDELADQFLALLNRVTEPDERLRLFGVDASSPIAAQLLDAIDRFIAGGGRGRRPWERVFEFLRVATVKVSQTRTETRTETRTTRGSLREVGDALCNRYARQAEDQGLFGPAEARPTEADCPEGEPANAEGPAAECDYSE